MSGDSQRFDPVEGCIEMKAISIIVFLYDVISKYLHIPHSALRDVGVLFLLL